MAKYEEPFTDTIDLFNGVIEKTGLDQLINIRVLSNNTAKQIFTVTRANELMKYITSDDIIIIINEVIFEQLTDEQRVIVAEEALAGIHFDSEKDKLVISKPDVVTFSGVLSKHTFDTWNVLRESITSLYGSTKQDEDESKAITG